MPRYSSERKDAYYIFGKGNHNITMVLVPLVIVVGLGLFLWSRRPRHIGRGYY